MSFEVAMKALGLEPRSQQVAMVEHVRQVMDGGRDIAFVQAGTGTGKSYVILSEAVANAVATGMPSVVVCPNNTLINQYVEKDAPWIAGALDARIAYIKGRNRYVCANSPAIKTAMFGQSLEKRRQVAIDFLHRDLEWANLGLSSDYGCPGSRRCKPNSLCVCPAKGDVELRCICPPACGIQVAKRRAADAHVVITNAHVLCWDARVRSWSDGAFGLLPEYGALFVDECHELESIGRDIMSVEIGDKSKVWDMSKRIRDWRKEMFDELRRAGSQEDVLNLGEPRHTDLLAHVGSQMSKYHPESEEHERLEMMIEFLTPTEDALSVVRLEPGVDAGSFKFVCEKRLIDASWFFRELFDGHPSVLASGTIPPSDKRRLGVPKARVEYVGHPFDYSRSRLWIAPYDARDRADLPARLGDLANAIEAVHNRGGGTLLLFTSWADLELVTTYLNSGFQGRVPIWVQGREETYAEDGGSLRQDVDEFRNAHGGVLAGVASLFTGLDLPGDTLQQVVLWKLPYAVPTAEVRAIQDRFGRSVYQDQMMMKLVQGIGRLVRTADDCGNVLIMDDRAARINWSSNPMAEHVAEFARM